MTGKLTAIGIISMAVLLTGAGCVEAATTANTVFKTETEGVYAAAEQADAEVGKSLFDLPTPRPTIAPVKIKISQSPLPTPPAENPYTVDGNVSEDAASPAASPVPANTPDSSDKPEYTVEDMDDTAGYVYAKSINLRSGPGEDYKIVREYQQNRKVTITGKSGDWYRVRVGKRKGFMLMEYIKLGDPPESTPKPTEKPKATSKPKATPKAEEIEVITPVETPSGGQGSMNGGGGYTGEELYLIAQVVRKEGDSESYTAVANVIYNRLHSSRFPSTVNGVIYQKGQFSTSSLKAPNAAAEAAVTSVSINGNTVLPSDVLFFRNSGSWAHELYAKIGGNYFYY